MMLCFAVSLIRGRRSLQQRPDHEEVGNRAAQHKKVPDGMEIIFFFDKEENSGRVKGPAGQQKDDCRGIHAAEKGADA